jgi:hypothetical protein
MLAWRVLNLYTAILFWESNRIFTHRICRFTTPDGKFDSGFYLADNDTMLLQAELVNYRKEEQKVFIQIDYEYVDGKSAKAAGTTFASAAR